MGPDKGEVGEGAEGGAGFMVGGFGVVTVAVDPGSGGGGVREVGWHVGNGDGTIGGEGGRGLEGGGGNEVGAGAGGGGGGAVTWADSGVRVAEGVDGVSNNAEEGVVACGG